MIIPKDHKLIRKQDNTYVVQRPDGTCAVYSDNPEPTMARQEFADECDINNLMKKYTYNQIPDIPGTVSEFSQVIDFQEMMQATIHVRTQFDSLPPNIRQRFQNDPQDLINFLGDSKNREEAIKLGLVDPKPEPTIDPVLTELKTLNTNLSKKKSSSNDE